MTTPDRRKFTFDRRLKLAEVEGLKKDGTDVLGQTASCKVNSRGDDEDALKHTDIASTQVLNLQSVHFRHHEIENDHGLRVVGRERQGFAPVRRRIDGESATLQHRRGKSADCFVIIDNERPTRVEAF